MQVHSSSAVLTLAGLGAVILSLDEPRCCCCKGVGDDPDVGDSSREAELLGDRSAAEAVAGASR